MNIRHFRALLLLAAALGTFHCNDNGVGPGGIGGLALVGTVTEPSGIPIPGVGIHYIFTITPTTQIAPLQKTLPTTTISFNLPDSGVVTLTILRYGTREVLDTLLNHAQLEAGMHQVTVDMTSFTNGFYIYRLLVGNQPPVERLMVLLNLDIRLLEAATPLTTTDLHGHFSLPYAELGFGTRITISNVNDPTIVGYGVIADSIDIVLTKPGYQTRVVPVTIDTTRNSARSFIMFPAAAGPI